MSYQDGWAAINLEMPDRIPRTEYSAETHWRLVEQVTGIRITKDSTEQERLRASSSFRKAWDYGYRWHVYTDKRALLKCHTSMGHAEYAEGGSDFDTDIQCPFEDPEELLDFQPQEVYGSLDHRVLVREYNEDYQTCIREGADLVNTTGIYITLVSGLLEIFGWDMMLMALGIDAKAFGETANRYAAWVQQYFNALADCDAPVITVHDDIVWTSGPFVSPEWYRRYVFPNYKKYFAPLLEAGKKIIFTSDGTYTEFLEDIADCGVHGFVMEPTTDLKYAAERFGKTHVLIGNVDTRCLLMGSREDIYRDVKQCIDIGRDCPGYIMAVGNHIPANTPVEKALYYNEVFEKLRRR